MVLKDFIKPIASSRTLKYVGLLALGMGAYSCLPMLKEASRYRDIADMPSGIHAAFTLVLGALLVFRTNTAYARWWEARTLWGGLVNACRNLAIKTTTLGGLSDSELDEIKRNVIAFPFALRNHLRDGYRSNAQIDDHVLTTHWEHVPTGIARELYRVIANAAAAQRIDGDVLRF